MRAQHDYNGTLPDDARYVTDIAMTVENKEVITTTQTRPGPGADMSNDATTEEGGPCELANVSTCSFEIGDMGEAHPLTIRPGRRRGELWDCVHLESSLEGH
jgi:hypothetical protein